jgi:hypothetical protein
MAVDGSQPAPGLPCALSLKGRDMVSKLGRTAPREREGAPAANAFAIDFTNPLMKHMREHAVEWSYRPAGATSNNKD